MPLVHDTARAFMPYPEAPVPQAATEPLAGLSFAVKDLFDVAGYPTSGRPGALDFKPHPPRGEHARARTARARTLRSSSAAPRQVRRVPSQGAN